MDAEEQQADPENVKEQALIVLVLGYHSLIHRRFMAATPDRNPPLPTKSMTLVSPNSSQDAAPVAHPRDGAGQSGSFASAGDRNVYSPTIYAPQPQAFYYRG
ncbi:hypothetical protein GOBAR_AA39562 [Gossypium barbadense]|uniref:Uncharacterized protein n=1 Tax=Gossypium barbadense TaxID=3634 RepID=A0A2P5VQN4_GOSBA|nr:hypothetical protein GOBAR_AA39562 [Gossypium barbadense]